MIREWVDVTVRSKAGRTPLHVAIEARLFEILNTLFTLGGGVGHLRKRPKRCVAINVAGQSITPTKETQAECFIGLNQLGLESCEERDGGRKMAVQEGLCSVHTGRIIAPCLHLPLIDKFSGEARPRDLCSHVGLLQDFLCAAIEGKFDHFDYWHANSIVR
jgi:hypothetical protein